MVKEATTDKKMYEAGADRYLLRHETINKELYKKLHPNSDFENRIRCLKNLKEIGYQVGSGFMVGLPNQTNEDLVNDLLFIKELSPQMCGIGPFISHKDTPLRDEKCGDMYKTVIMVALTRLLLPDILLPSTTALSTIDTLGREKGLKAGGTVVMPNLSPRSVRQKYSLYDGKVYTKDEDADLKKEIEEKIIKAGFEVDMGKEIIKIGLEGRDNMNNTPNSSRKHIGIYGKTNAGKSSLVNRF